MSVLLFLIIHAAVTFLVTIDPVGVAPIFASLSHGRSKAERDQAALTGVLVGSAVLYVFAVLGRELLDILGVSLDAFRIAGGVLLFLVAIEMVFARRSGLRSTTTTEDAEAHRRADISVFPIGIPLIAGPGAIASAMLLTSETSTSWAEKAAVLVVLGLVLLLTYFALKAASEIVRLLGVTGTNVIGRVLGIVLAGLAMQFIVDGLRTVLPGLG